MCTMFYLSVCVGFLATSECFLIRVIYHLSKLVLQTCQEDNNSSPECVLHFLDNIFLFVHNSFCHVHNAI